MNSGYKNHHADDSSLLDLQLFKELYCIYYFDLTSQPESLYKQAKQAELEVRWSGTQSSAGYIMWVIYESERLIKFKGVSGSLALIV